MRKKKLLVEMRKISKSFDGFWALRSVDFKVGYGEVVALVGDNGAGKSTLIKILTGVYLPDEGEIYIEGKKVKFSSPAEARSMGIETVHQRLGLVAPMSVTENFFLGKEITKRVGPLRILDKKKMNEIAKNVLNDIGIRIASPEKRVVSTLSGGEQQAVSIGRCIYFGVKLAVLDEPTASLSLAETQKVLESIRGMKKRGLSVIFISHNLSHVWPVADRLVVLEHGIKVGDFGKNDTSSEEISKLIMGKVEE
ncbi:sugar ABC transporter ATP-binding protein [Candidatus Bathyarchaeota archaeon]|nr:sugar ABC transporter ATP-binding protein [Candidatus Bathyarchaeota archaeon]